MDLNGNIYFGDIGGNFYSINSGKINWKTYLNAPIFSSPSFHQELGIVIIGSCDNSIYAFNSNGQKVK